MGTILAEVQSWGTLPIDSDWLNIDARLRTTFSAVSFSNVSLVYIKSGHVAFFTVKILVLLLV